MGLPNSVKWYHILGAFVVFGTYDAYRTARRRFRRLIQGTTLLPTHPSEKSLLYQTYPSNVSTPDADIDVFNFTALPPEIRCLVWELACSQPRTIELSVRGARDGDNNKKASEYMALTSAGCRVPAVLLVSRESRRVAQRHYEQTFQTIDVEAACAHIAADNMGAFYGWRTRKLFEQRYIYVNFACDTIYVALRDELDRLLAAASRGEVKGVEKVRMLASRIPYPPLEATGRDLLDLAGALDEVYLAQPEVLVALREICLVQEEMGQQRCNLGRELRLVKWDDEEGGGVDERGLRTTTWVLTREIKKRLDERDWPYEKPVVRFGELIEAEEVRRKALVQRARLKQCMGYWERNSYVKGRYNIFVE